MKLDEAIRHAESVVEENEKSLREWKECKNRGTVGWSDFDKEKVDTSIARCSKCAEKHRQLTEWLKELKAYREQGNVVMDEILGIIHSTIYDFMNESCDDEESPLTDKDKLLLSVNKAICNNLKSMNEQFEKNIREFEVKLESGVKIDRGPLLQRKNAAWEIKEDLVRREEALEIIRTSDVWYSYTEKTPSDADIAFNFMKSEIKDLPSVQPKIGHWIRTIDQAGNPMQECDKCGWAQIFDTNFCPNCGQPKMQESEG